MVAQDEVLVEVEGHTLRINNLAKVMYPATGWTKGEVLHYYAAVAGVLLPLLTDRAVTRVRWPHGVGRKSFFEKNAPGGTPSWVRTVEVPTSGSRGSGVAGVLRFPVVDDLATLTWLANLAALELHVHQWTVGSEGEVRNPDRMVIDLDPGHPAGLHECARVALLVRSKLTERGLGARPVTSGSKGLHLYAPLPTVELDPHAISDLAREMAEELEREHPGLVTASMTRSRRTGKVFLDWSQNSAAKTTLTPYSLRGTERPQVATPLTWAEVEKGAEDPLALEQFTPEQVLERIARHGDIFSVTSSD